MEDFDVPQGVITVTASCRPKRYAFLVDLSDDSIPIINKIIEFNQTLWGGRYNVIIPLTNGEIESNWWEFLSGVDPDIIFSLVPLSKALKQNIYRFIEPAEIFELETADYLRASRYTSSYTFNVGIERLIYYIFQNWKGLEPPTFFKIFGTPSDELDKAFYYLNFGKLDDDLITSLPSTELIPHKPLNLSQITLESFLKSLKSVRQPVFPIDYSQYLVTGNITLSSESSRNLGFQLVVGDTCLDLIYSWNRAWVAETPFARESTFWLPTKFAFDSDLIRMLEPRIGHDATHHKISVVSHSLSVDHLHNISETIRLFTGKPVGIQKLTEEDFPSKITQTKSFLMDHYTKQLPLSENKGLVEVSPPSFVSSLNASEGWMVDFEIQFHPERYYYTNIRPNWQLPKGRSLATLFFTSQRMSRINKNGHPSVAANGSECMMTLEIPSDNHIFWTLVNRNFYNRKDITSSKQRFAEIGTSDKGSYLEGLIQLFGSVFYAGIIFENDFWRNVFYKMAGNPVLRKTIIEGRIRRKIEEALLIKDSINAFSKDELTETLFSNLIDTFVEPFIERQWSIKKLQSEFGRFYGKTESWTEDGLDELNDLLEAGVLIQGTNLKCPLCETTTWYIVDQLKTNMQCHGCMTHFTLPPAPEWTFKLNSLVTNALNFHGLLPVLEALYKLNRWTSGMFLYLPSQNVFEVDKKEPFSDLDLLLITNGELIIGEVKSSSKGFDNLDKLKDIALDILPEKVILVAPNGAWMEGDPLIEQFKSELNGHGVSVIPLPLEWYYTNPKTKNNE